MASGRLTAAFVRTISKPGRYGDGGRGSFGLSLLVRSSGKHWQQRYRKNGKYSSRGLGTYPAVTLEQARALAVSFALQDRPVAVRSIYGATDEQVEERMAPARHMVSASVVSPPATATATVNREYRPPTLRLMYSESLDFRTKGFKGTSKTAAQAMSLFNAYVPPAMADTPINEITSAHMVTCLSGVWRDKPATAKKLVQHLGATMNHAMGQDLIDVDPLAKAKIGLGRLKPRGKNHDALPHSEVGGAVRKIQTTTAYPTTKLAFTFLVLTATRSNEARGACWNEVDWDARTWTVPASRMKGERGHRVPLSDAAMSVLQSARHLTNGEGLIFPSATGKVLSDNTLSKLLRENGIAAVPHGFRSSFRDWAAELTDYPSEIAEHALGHVEGSATVRAYRRTDYFEKRQHLMEDWATYIVP